MYKMISLILFLTMLTGTQAVFTPVDRDALKTAVTACLGQGGSGRSHCTATNPANGKPYGLIGSWDTSLVTDMNQSKLFR